MAIDDFLLVINNGLFRHYGWRVIFFYSNLYPTVFIRNALPVSLFARQHAE
jgi:hypothetical protein